MVDIFKVIATVSEIEYQSRLTWLSKAMSIDTPPCLELIGDKHDAE